MGNEPKHDLNKVKEIAEKFLSGAINSVYFSAPSRSTEIVIEALLCTEQKARASIVTGVLHLTPGDFSHRTIQWNDPCAVADVYGLEQYENIDWYVKFMFEEDELGEPYLEQVSFHPVEKPLQLQDGRTLKPRDS